MQKLWEFEDYVGHLKHANSSVRSWAFDAVESLFPRRFAAEAAGLIGDENEHLACMAPRYLAKHHAVQFAPEILESFNRDRGNVPSNCALALGRLRYQPALTDILSRLSTCQNENTFLGIVHYLGDLSTPECHQALRGLFQQTRMDYFGDAVAHNLLRHYDPADVSLVLENYFKVKDHDPQAERLLTALLRAAGAERYYTEFKDHYSGDILESPNEVLDEFLASNLAIEVPVNQKKEIVKLLEKEKFQDLTTSLAFAVQKLASASCPEPGVSDQVIKLAGQNMLASATLKEFSKKSSDWQRIKGEEELTSQRVLAVLVTYFSILERQRYVKALDSNAGRADLMSALKFSGPGLPRKIMDRLVELNDPDEVRAILTDDFNTWGDTWAVELMGQIGDASFVPDLINIVCEADGLSFVHENAVKALRRIDPAGHRPIFESIQSGTVADPLDAFVLLESLPYPEAFDLALSLWHKAGEERHDLLEFFGICLEKIGDARGIPVLQKLITEDMAPLIGISLEVLAVLYNEDIRELPLIRKWRRIEEKRRRQRTAMIDQWEPSINPETVFEPQSEPGHTITVRRTTRKVGRNEPCPCGSGKKYKKCCLNNSG